MAVTTTAIMRAHLKEIIDQAKQVALLEAENECQAKRIAELETELQRYNGLKVLQANGTK